MNDKQKKQQKLEKWGRQIGYTAFKLINLSQRDMAQIRGNGLVITIKKWEDVVNERKYIEDNRKNETKEKESGDKGQTKQGESTEERKEETPKEETSEKILEDKSFKEQVAKIREGWKK